MPDWIDPKAIEFRISPSAHLRGVVPGDWDIECRRRFTETAKYRSMVQHFIDGLPWEETVLFTDSYARRLKKDGHVGRARTMGELARHYRERFDPMAEEFRKHGFSTTAPNGKRYPLPTLLIGRDGDVFIGNQGNHRMALAQVLGLDRIAGEIVCRHPMA